LVALAMGRSPAMVLAALAVQRAGGAFLPIDPDHPAERVAYLLADARPALVISDPATTDLLPEHAAPRLVLDPATAELGPLVPGAAATDPRRAGYVTYTSGSTGRPKGVVVTHAGIAALAEALVDRFGLDRSARVLQLGSPAFDIWVSELCLACGSGGTLVVPEPGPLAGPELARVLAARRITCTLVPPAVLADVTPADCPELAVVCLGADVCPPDLVRAWSGAGRRVLNAYGPTEATVVATLSDPLPTGPDAPPIGRPVLNSAAHVLDSALLPTPVGVPGELYLAGPALARGYLGRPALTAERFVADPYAALPGARMYRTGDLVRRRLDGQLDFLGRTDQQIKLRGLRIEPGEIEAALTSHPAVDRAVVVLRADGAARPRLVAYLVARPGAALQPEELLPHALATLPGTLVPSAFVVLDALPLTPQGKLDRAALPAPEAEPARPTRAPGSAREELLRTLFDELLDAHDTASDADFFALGGDSITAIQAPPACPSPRRTC
jgi:amino acid adenylation domain-containing protein